MLSGVCQPPTACLSLISLSFIHSRNAVICLICILLSFHSILSPLPSFHRGFTQACIHGECQMPVSPCNLTIGALIRNCENLQLWIPLTVFLVDNSWVHSVTQMCFFMRHFSFNFFGKVFAKLSVPHHAGATGVWRVQCRTIAFEGQGNLIWEIHMDKSVHCS